ncbi:hypothetical protein T439DRAFT_323770 [Meredithblackwellia eburnea MCA 4105]
MVPIQALLGRTARVKGPMIRGAESWITPALFVVASTSQMQPDPRVEKWRSGRGYGREVQAGGSGFSGPHSSPLEPPYSYQQHASSSPSPPSPPSVRHQSSSQYVRHRSSSRARAFSSVAGPTAPLPPLPAAGGQAGNARSRISPPPTPSSSPSSFSSSRIGVDFEARRRRRSGTKQRIGGPAHEEMVSEVRGVVGVNEPLFDEEIIVPSTFLRKSPQTRTRSRRPAAALEADTQHPPESTPPRPPPRPSRSPRREAATPPSTHSFSSSSHILNQRQQRPDSPPPSSSSWQDADPTFRLDRAQVLPPSFIAARQSLTSHDFQRLMSQKLPGAWVADSVANTSQSTQHGANDVQPAHADSAKGSASHEPSPDPEEWARQRRMSSLLSGIGLVFGSISIGATTVLAEEQDNEEVEELAGGEEGAGLALGSTRSSPRISLRSSLRPSPAESTEGLVESSEPGTPSVSSESECFESADEGEEAGSGSRRASARSVRRTSYTQTETFNPSNLTTIVDNSPVIRNSATFQGQALAEASTSTSAEVSIAFGYAYDPALDKEDEADLEEPSSPKSLKQLLRDSKRLSRPISTDFSVEVEQRRLSRQEDRLSLDDEGLGLHIAELVESKVLSRSSYVPSSRPLVSRANTGSSSVSDLPPTTPTTSSPEMTPATPLSPVPTPSNVLDTQAVGSPASNEEDLASEVLTIAGLQSPPLVAPNPRRRSSSTVSSLSSPFLGKTDSKTGPTTSPIESPIHSPSTLSVHRLADPRPRLRQQLSSEAVARSRSSGDASGGGGLKPTRRLSMLFQKGVGRRRTSSKDSDNGPADDQPTPRSPLNRNRSSNSTRTLEIIKSPTPSAPAMESPQSSAEPDSIKTTPTLGSAPFSVRTWRSSMDPEEYEVLLSRYGRLEMRRQEVIRELCETERSFVTGLRGVIRVFTLPLRTPEGSWIKGVPVAVSRLLDWLDDILAVHSRIANALQNALDTGCTEHCPVITRIAEVILPYVGQLEVHQPYLVRFEAVTQAIDSMTADSASDFGEFVRMQSSLPECGALSLSSFLLKPVQRLMKYPLFFKQLLELTPPTHPDRIATLSLLHSTDSMIRVMQEVRTREDEYEEAKVLQSRIRGFPEGFKLARRDRRLIAHGPLRRVHISDKDRTLLEMDAMAKASSVGPRPMSILTLTPDAVALSPTIANSNSSRRQSTVSDSGSSSRSVGSMTYSETSAASRSTPATPVSTSFETSSPSVVTAPSAKPEGISFGGLSLGNRPEKSTKIIKTKAKESSVYAFVFSDLVVLTTKSSEGIRFIRTSRNTTRRLEQGPTYKTIDVIGLSRVLGVSDLSGKTEHDHLIEVDLLPMPNGDEAMAPLSLGTASLATSIYLTVPPRAVTTPRQSPSIAVDLQLKERTRWLQAFERSYLFALRSLSFPSLLNAHTAPITQTERMTSNTTIHIESDSIPRSPSEQLLDMYRGGTEVHVTDANVDGKAAREEREERAYWSMRLKQVRKELEGSIIDGQISGVKSPVSPAQGWSPSAAGGGKMERKKSSGGAHFSAGLGLGDLGMITH